MANIRKHALHQATTYLTTLAPHASVGETKSAIMLEALNVSAMMQNHHLAQAIADVGMYEFRRQLMYKGQWYPPFHRGWYGCEVFLANRFFPSTKRCSQCAQEKAVGLADRVYCYEYCGQVLDRDLNAAINLEQLFYS